MPTYDYACANCGGFDALRPVGARDEPAACPHCAAPSPRVFASAPRLALMEPATRLAVARNERARHEPTASRDYQRLRHPAGCGCCSAPTKRGGSLAAPNGLKVFAGKRPWMISH
jgi:putative FmdB family regulatory protein